MLRHHGQNQLSHPQRSEKHKNNPKLTPEKRIGSKNNNINGVQVWDEILHL